MGLREEGYWDEHYKLELSNFQEDGDEGEVWFGKGLSRKIVLWIKDQVESGQKIRILDIGCGNAFLLYSLVDSLDHDELLLHGIDYSVNSIELSRSIIESKGLSSRIKVNQCDFLDTNQLESTFEGTKFNYIIDKGTFDAICLLSSDQILEETKRNYMKSVYSIVDNNSKFILASCNHTEEELCHLFKLDCPNRLPVEMIGKIDTPTLKFGGKEGSQVTCLIFRFGRI